MRAHRNRSRQPSGLAREVLTILEHLMQPETIFLVKLPLLDDEGHEQPVLISTACTPLQKLDFIEKAKGRRTVQICYLADYKVWSNRAMSLFLRVL